MFRRGRVRGIDALKRPVLLQRRLTGLGATGSVTVKTRGGRQIRTVTQGTRTWPYTSDCATQTPVTLMPPPLQQQQQQQAKASSVPVPAASALMPTDAVLPVEEEEEITFKARFARKL